MRVTGVNLLAQPELETGSCWASMAPSSPQAAFLCGTLYSLPLLFPHPWSLISSLGPHLAIGKVNNKWKPLEKQLRWRICSSLGRTRQEVCPLGSYQHPRSCEFSISSVAGSGTGFSDTTRDASASHYLTVGHLAALLVLSSPLLSNVLFCFVFLHLAPLQTEESVTESNGLIFSPFPLFHKPVCFFTHVQNMFLWLSRQKWTSGVQLSVDILLLFFPIKEIPKKEQLVATAYIYWKERMNLQSIWTWKHHPPLVLPRIPVQAGEVPLLPSVCRLHAVVFKVRFWNQWHHQHYLMY